MDFQLDTIPISPGIQKFLHAEHFKARALGKTTYEQEFLQFGSIFNL
jgi:hypothetical protein